MARDQNHADGASAPMRLVIDCTPLTGGGGTQVASAFLENLSAKSDLIWQAVVSTAMQRALSDRLKRDERITVVAKRNWLDLFFIGRRLARIEKSFEPDVVFTVFGPTYFKPASRHLIGFALPLMIYDVDDALGEPSIIAKFKMFLGRRAFHRADHTVVETETVRQRLHQRLGIDEDRISVIGNSVNPLIVEAMDRTAMPDADVFGIIVPSAYYRHKNLAVIPRIAAEMRRLDPGFAFEFRLTLDPGSPAWHAITDLASKLGVEKYVKTLGVVSLAALAGHYQQAAATFLPTLREASTAVYPETFFACRPLITTDIDFARELCGDAAAYVSYDDLPKAAATILHIGKDSELRDALVQNGKRQLAVTYPNPVEKFELQMALIRKVAAGRGPRSAAR